MPNIVQLKAANAERWSVAKPTRNFTAVANRLIYPAAKMRYEVVEAKTGVPWYFIAVVHQRESSESWAASLAQGDPWNKVSRDVPVGRGPFKSWEAAAVDALTNCAPFAAHNTDWSIGGLLTMLEFYNGKGYAVRGIPSPYIWSGTDQYIKGKYIRDHIFDPDKIDVQPGCAGLLMAMIKADPTIEIDE